MADPTQHLPHLTRASSAAYAISHRADSSGDGRWRTDARGQSLIPTPRTGIILLAVIALTACQSLPPRATTAPAADVPDAAAQVSIATANPLQPAPPPTAYSARPTPQQPLLPGIRKTSNASARAAPSEPRPDLWQQMRDGFALPGCDYAPGAERWARRYAASPRRFAAVLDELLPALEYTHRQVQAAQLPSEFALLPIVESHFRPHVASQDRPAGIWQIVGGTGRQAGLRMDAWVDERLNLAASTDAAIWLLDRYGDYFKDDWRLATFAYNAGEFRVRRALDRHTPDDSFASLRGLGLAEGSYEYLTKLLALACLVRDPGRFDLDLPTLEPERRLQRVDLDGVIGSTLARALSGMSAEEFARFNAGLRRDRTPPGDQEFPLLVRSPFADRAQLLMQELPAQQRIGWHRRALAADESLENIATSHGLAPSLLLTLNGIDENAGAIDRARFWIPGRSVPDAATGDDLAAGADVHVVRSGDSLWTIARRHGLTVPQLLRYNALDNSRLMPGQRLRLSAP